jgi:hypothetical protein
MRQNCSLDTHAQPNAGIHGLERRDVGNPLLCAITTGHLWTNHSLESQKGTWSSIQLFPARPDDVDVAVTLN